MSGQTYYDPLEDLTDEQMEERQLIDHERGLRLHPQCPFRRNQRGYGLWITWAKGVVTGRQMGKEPVPDTIPEFRKGQNLGWQPYWPKTHRLLVPKKEVYHE